MEVESASVRSLPGERNYRSALKNTLKHMKSHENRSEQLRLEVQDSDDEELDFALIAKRREVIATNLMKTTE